MAKKKPANQTTSQTAQNKQMLTHKRAIEAIQVVEQAIDEWRNAPDEQEITGSIWHAANEANRLFQTKEVEKEAWRAVLAFDDFARELVEWRQKSDLPVQPASYRGGHRALWRAWDAVIESMKPARKEERLESIRELERQGHDNAYIARMYRWRNHNGEPDAAKVAEAKQKQTDDYHLGPIHHRFEQEQRELAQRWAARTVTPPEPATAKRRTPESLDTLISQMVPAQQIVKMTGLPAEQVAARADKLGVVLPGAGMIKATPVELIERERDRELKQRQDEARQAKFAKVDPLEGFGLEERIHGLHEQGLTAAEITGFLNDRGETVSLELVGGVLDEHDKGLAS